MEGAEQEMMVISSDEGELLGHSDLLQRLPGRHLVRADVRDKLLVADGGRVHVGSSVNDHEHLDVLDVGLDPAEHILAGGATAAAVQVGHDLGPHGGILELHDDEGRPPDHLLRLVVGHHLGEVGQGDLSGPGARVG